MQRVVGRAAGHSVTEEMLFAPGQRLLVARRGTQSIEMIGEATDRRAYERPLSFTTITMRRFFAVAMLLSASHARPPVNAPSPMTPTVHVRFPRRCFSLEIPSTHAIEEDACEDSTTSCSDSARDG